MQSIITPQRRLSTDVDVEDDPFPSTAAAQTSPTHRPLGPSLYASPTYVVDPRTIPLPPSPTPIKTSLPHRRPKEWITSIPNNHPSNPGVPIIPSAQRRSSSQTPGTRIVSGQGSLSISGRRVSGAMQYALFPLPHHDTSSSSETVADAYGEEVSIGGGDRSILELDEDEALDQTERDQQQDEIWMSHIREQLSTLFPDFFDPNLDPDVSEVEGGTRGMALSAEVEDEVNLGLASRSTSGVTSASTASDWEVTTPRTATMGLSGLAFGGGGLRGAGGLRSVPSVREEIGGLREEIERLRGVVGGLAEDLGRDRMENAARGQTGPSTHDDTREGDQDIEPRAGGVCVDPREEGRALDDAEDAELEEVELFVGNEESETLQNIEELPDAFLRNAPSIAKLVRSLDVLFHGSVERHDGNVFDGLNLAMIEGKVKSLLGQSNV